MKLLMLIDSPPDRGGAGLEACAEARAAGSAHEVVLALPRQARPSYATQGLTLRPLHSVHGSIPILAVHPLLFLRVAEELRQLIAAENAQIVHAQMINTAWCVGYLKARGRIPAGTKLIFSDHASVRHFKWVFRLLTDLLVSRQYDRIVSLTQGNVAYWEKHGCGGRTLSIPNALDPLFETPVADDRERLGLRSGVPIIMLAGRLSREKNWPLAMEILRGLRGRQVQVILAVLVKGKKQEALLVQLSQALADSGLPGVLLRDRDQTQIRSLYAAADLFLCTSRYESFGRTLIEAMSQGCVPLSTRSPGPEEIVREVGALLPAKAPAFIQAIERYAADPALLRREQLRARESCLARFGQQAVEQKRLALYNGCGQ